MRYLLIILYNSTIIFIVTKTGIEYVQHIESRKCNKILVGSLFVRQPMTEYKTVTTRVNLYRRSCCYHATMHCMLRTIDATT